jgi:hypothetical protein
VAANLVEWRTALRLHPNQQLVSRVLHGLEVGFNIGYSGDRSFLRVCRNHPSAIVHAEGVRESIAKDLSNGYLAAFDVLPHPSLVLSPLGCIVKASGKHRRLHDLSFGSRVNADVSADYFRYSSLSNALDLIASVGQSAWLAKLDIKDAFRLLPIAPSDCHLVSFQFEGSIYVEKNLPFGLKSSPSLFDDFASLFSWIVADSYPGGSGSFRFVRYCDDFLLIGSSKVEVESMVAHFKRCSQLLGVPLALDKCPGNAVRSLDFLGAILDIDSFSVSISDSRKAKVKLLVSKSLSQPVLSLKDLQKLLGHLAFISSIVPFLKPFLKPLYAMLSLRPPSTYGSSLFARSPLPANSLLPWSFEALHALRAWWFFFDRWPGHSLIRFF